MAESITGFEQTNENLYEIMWNVRLQLSASILDEVEDIQDALTIFRQADSSYFWGAEGIAVHSPNGGPSRNYYSGEVKLVPRDPEDAKEVFSAAEEASEKQIETIIKEITDDTDLVVELGAGYGGNLIRLDRASIGKTGKTLSERKIRVLMAEYTTTGRNLCEAFLKCKNSPEMELHFIDHKAPDLSFLGSTVNPLILTVHSIEQVAAIPSDYFKILSQAGQNVRGIHIEPVGFQFEPENPKWKAHEDFVKRQEYNLNFASVIKQAEKNGYISIDKIDTNFAAGQEENPSTLVVWSSKN